MSRDSWKIISVKSARGRMNQPLHLIHKKLFFELCDWKESTALINEFDKSMKDYYLLIFHLVRRKYVLVVDMQFYNINIWTENIWSALITFLITNRFEHTVKWSAEEYVQQ